MAGVIDKTIDKAIGKKNRKMARRHFSQHVLKRSDRLFSVRKWVLDWFALVAAVLFSVGIQSNWFVRVYSTSDWTNGGPYSEATLGRITTLNPLYASNASENAIKQLIFSSLFKYDRSGNIKGDLATSIITSDGKHFEVELRQDAVWHDGQVVNADDVIKTFSFIKDPNARASMFETFYGTTITKIDDYKIAFDLQGAYYNFASYLTFAILPEHILRDVDPAKLVEHSFSLNPIGSGPFAFHLIQDSEESQANIIFMNANKRYYSGQPLLDRFVVYAYNERKDVIAAVNDGAVDASASLSANEKGAITNRNMIAYETAINSGIFAFLNVRSPAMSDINLRRALQVGIDTVGLRQGLGDGNLIAQDFPYLSRLTGLNTTEISELAPKYDFARAKQILLDHGYSYDAENRLIKDGKNVEINIVTLETGFLAEATLKIADNLSALGINVHTNISSETSAAGLTGQQSFLQTVVAPRSYDMLIYETDLGSNGDAFATYHSSQLGRNKVNFSNYSSKIADDLLLSVRLTSDPSLQNAKRQAFTKLWLQEVPAIGLYRQNMVYWHMKTVRSFGEDVRVATPSTRFTDVIYWSVNQKNVYRTP